MLAPFLFVGTAHAEVFNCGTYQNTSTFFDGYYQPSNSYAYEGARATLVTRYGAVCDTDTGKRTSNTIGANNFTNNWTMIANNVNDANAGWAQSGFERDYADNGVYFFAQQFKGYSFGGLQ